jgi:hypothetical protein
MKEQHGLKSQSPQVKLASSLKNPIPKHAAFYYIGMVPACQESLPLSSGARAWAWREVDDWVKTRRTSIGSYGHHLLYVKKPECLSCRSRTECHVHVTRMKQVAEKVEFLVPLLIFIRNKL